MDRLDLVQHADLTFGVAERIRRLVHVAQRERIDALGGEVTATRIAIIGSSHQAPATRFPNDVYTVTPRVPGVIGLGAMGKPMAKNLLKAGFAETVGRQDIILGNGSNEIIDLLEIPHIRNKTVGMLPYGLQDCVVRGNATKINLLLLREYLRRFTFEELFTELEAYGGQTASQVIQEKVYDRLTRPYVLEVDQVGKPSGRLVESPFTYTSRVVGVGGVVGVAVGAGVAVSTTVGVAVGGRVFVGAMVGCKVAVAVDCAVLVAPAATRVGAVVGTLVGALVGGADWHAARNIANNKKTNKRFIS